MGRNFPGATTDHIDLGDITAARFVDTAVWSFLCFFRIENLDDDRVIVAKGDTGPTTQFFVRVDKPTAPEEIEVSSAGSIVITGGSNVQLNTWYLIAVVNDGTSNATGLTLYLVGMDGTFLDDGVTGNPNTAVADLTESILLGTRTSNDPIDGDLAYAAYIQAELTKEDIVEYLYHPAHVVARHQSSGVPFFLPLGVSSPEVDWGGSDNSGTVNGTTTIGDNPPVVGPLFGFDIDWMSVAAGIDFSSVGQLGQSGGMIGRVYY